MSRYTDALELLEQAQEFADANLSPSELREFKAMAREYGASGMPQVRDWDQIFKDEQLTRP